MYSQNTSNPISNNNEKKDRKTATSNTDNISKNDFVDVAEYYQFLSDEKLKVLNDWFDDIANGLNYEDCKKFIADIEKVGLTADYGLDAEIIDLRFKNESDFLLSTVINSKKEIKAEITYNADNKTYEMRMNKILIDAGSFKDLIEYFNFWNNKY